MRYYAKDNSSIEDILKMLRLDYGKVFEKLIYNPSNNSSKYIIIALNGKDIRLLDNIRTIIKEGDRITFLPAIAGG